MTATEYISRPTSFCEHDDAGVCALCEYTVEAVSGDERAMTTSQQAAPIRMITARVARRLLREVVAAYGRHHSIGQQPCAYIKENCPLCMVGCALYLAGLSEDELYELDRHEPTTISRVQLPAWVRMTDPARRVLQAAQSAQDDTAERKGLPWGAALDVALAVRPYQQTAVAA